MTTEEASDFPSPAAIQQIHNCPGPIPLKEAQKLVDWLLHIGWLRRYLCGNGFNRLRHSLTRNPIPGIVPYNNKGACNYQLPPKEQSLERTSSAPALQAAPPRHGAPSNHLLLRANVTWVRKSHRTAANKAVVQRSHKHFPQLSLGSGQREPSQSTVLQKTAWLHAKELNRAPS